LHAKLLKPVIFGIEGKKLKPEEKDFFLQHNPSGYILFSRNCESPEQIKELNAELKEISGKDTLILIDQEGGRVARLKPPHWRKSPPAGVFAKLAEKDIPLAQEAVYLNHRLIAQELYELGINVDCAPMLDLLIPGSHDIVGDRSFGSEVEQVSMLAGEACRGLLDGGILPVIKHIPGHGRAMADSHESLPVVDESLEILQETDFIPFKKLSNMPIAMTAHIKYTAIDKNQPATLSKKVIDLIRTEIGFTGVILTDDLSMKALQGNFARRTINSIKAGCDIVLHCNGIMAEMKQIAEACPKFTDKSLARLNNAKTLLKNPENFNQQQAIVRLEEILSS